MQTNGHPILSDDGTDVESVLAVSLDLSTLGVNALRMRIPEGATFSVVDRNRTVMVRVPEGLHPLGYDTIGASAPETFPDLQDSAAEPYILVGVDLDVVQSRLWGPVEVAQAQAADDGAYQVSAEVPPHY